jgi:hypothetical protein
MSDYDEDESELGDEIAEIDLALDEGPKLDTEQLQRDFEVIGYATPFVVVRRKSDGLLGTLEYLSWPRTYFGWTPAA